MAYYGLSLNDIEHKLYEKGRSFTRFESITEEDLIKVDAMLEKFNNISDASPLDRYERCLRILTSPNIHFELPTYDLKILYLIRAIDKDLKALKVFLATDIPPLERINDESDETKVTLLQERDHNISMMTNQIRSLIGIYNSQLITYEQYYFRRFVKDKEFIKQANKEYTIRLLRSVKKDMTFDSFSDEDIEELIKKVERYLSNFANPDLFTTSFHIVSQNALLELKSYKEQLAFLIMTCDPELKILKIYEEESRIPEVKRRTEEEFSFYDGSLITIEKAYHQRFCPEKEISIWSK